MRPIDEINEQIKYFVDEWRFLCKSLLRWPDDRAESWIKSMWPMFERSPNTFDCDKPPWYLIRREILKPLEGKMPEWEIDNIGSELWYALINRTAGDPYLNEDFDWKAARERMNKVLAKYEPLIQIGAD